MYSPAYVLVILLCGFFGSSGGFRRGVFWQNRYFRNCYMRGSVNGSDIGGIDIFQCNIITGGGRKIICYGFIGNNHCGIFIVCTVIFLDSCQAFPVFKAVNLADQF